MGSQFSQLVAEEAGRTARGDGEWKDGDGPSRGEVAISKVKANKDKEVIAAVEELAKHLPRLYALAAKGCKVQRIPQEVVAPMMAHLVVLNLEHNKLTALPSMAPLTGLRELHLPQNKFTAFPSTLNELVHLEVLDLSSNAIPDVPAKDIDRMRALRSLNLSKNVLSAFPSALCGLSAVTSIDLSENRMPSLPKQVGASSSSSSRLGHLVRQWEAALHCRIHLV